MLDGVPTYPLRLSLVLVADYNRYSEPVSRAEG